eukprot:15473193-Alexandrium_andersonii.AAC.1
MPPERLGRVLMYNACRMQRLSPGPFCQQQCKVASSNFRRMWAVPWPFRPVAEGAGNHQHMPNAA